MEQHISLTTALTGGQFVVTHLDNRKLLIKIAPGEVIKPGDVKVIQGEGMPTYKNPFEKGNLYITFALDFPSPNWIKPEQLAQLKQVFFSPSLFKTTQTSPSCCFPSFCRRTSLSKWPRRLRTPRWLILTPRSTIPGATRGLQAPTRRMTKGAGTLVFSVPSNDLSSREPELSAPPLLIHSYPFLSILPLSLVHFPQNTIGHRKCLVSCLSSFLPSFPQCPLSSSPPKKGRPTSRPSMPQDGPSSTAVTPSTRSVFSIFLFLT